MDPRSALRTALLSPEEAEAMDAHGQTEAAVLVPVFGYPGWVAQDAGFYDDTRYFRTR